MAFIVCQSCGKKVSDKAGSCPHCGADPTQAKATPEPATEPAWARKARGEEVSAEELKAAGASVPTWAKVIIAVVSVFLALWVGLVFFANVLAQRMDPAVKYADQQQSARQEAKVKRAAAFELVEFNYQSPNSIGSVEFAGRVRISGSEEIQSARALVKCLDPDGRLVTMSDTFVEPRPIAPGGETFFSGFCRNSASAEFVQMLVD
jgi:hypothetical protein